MEERNWERDSGENPMLAGLTGFESIFGVLSERWEIKNCIGTIYTQTNQDFASVAKKKNQSVPLTIWSVSFLVYNFPTN
jgi:hypothetical protein